MDGTEAHGSRVATATRRSHAMDRGLMTERSGCQEGQLSPGSGSAGSKAANGPMLGLLPAQPLAVGGTTRGSTKGGAASTPARTGTLGGSQGEASR